MLTGLQGRNVVVTGGNANIGRGIALAFAAEGANVVIVGRDEVQGLRVREELVDAGPRTRCGELPTSPTSLRSRP